MTSEYNKVNATFLQLAYVEAKAGVDFFMAIEKERTAAIRQGIADNRIVISDRTVLSLAAYQLALERQRRVLPDDQIAVPNYTFEIISNAIEQGDVEMPEKLIILHPADQATHDARVQRRGPTSMGALNQWFFSLALSEATDEAATILLDKTTSRQTLLSCDGPEAFAQNSAAACAFFGLTNILERSEG